jgi:hypothetical protein
MSLSDMVIGPEAATISELVYSAVFTCVYIGGADALLNGSSLGSPTLPLKMSVYLGRRESEISAYSASLPL